MKRKVLFFTTSGDYHGGGVMCLIETLRYIDRDKIDPYVVIPTHGSTEEQLEALNIPYVIIKNYDWLFSERVLHSLSFKIKRPLQWLVNQISELRIYRYLQKMQFDAYHLNSLYSDFGVRAATALKIPIYWHLREFVDENPWTSTFLNERKAYRVIERSHKLLAVSECIKQFYMGKMPNANIEVIYDGVDIISKLRIRNNVTIRHPLRLSLIGGVSEVKGHIDAIRAVSLLIENGVKCFLSVYGRKRSSGYFQLLKEEISRLKVDSYIRFLGNKSDMQEVYNETDIVLVCSRCESFGRVAVEAMYQNIPVIGADNTGTSELIKGNPMSILYKTGDANDLYRKIRDMANRQFDDKDLQDNHRHVMHFSSEESARNLTTALLD